MSRLEGQIRAIVAALSKLRVQSALVGGLAVSARAEPRFTRDVDLAVAVARGRNLEAALDALLARP